MNSYKTMDTFIMGYNDVQTKAAFLNIRTKILQMKKKLKKQNNGNFQQET